MKTGYPFARPGAFLLLSIGLIGVNLIWFIPTIHNARTNASAFARYGNASCVPACFVNACV